MLLEIATIVVVFLAELELEISADAEVLGETIMRTVVVVEGVTVLDGWT